MKLHAMMLLGMASLVAGCAMEAAEPDEIEGAEDVGESDGALTASNYLAPNGLTTNGLTTNGLTTNALSLDAISEGNRGSLENPGELGDAARQFMKYAVSCAFDEDHSFDFTWIDSAEVVHHESYVGSLALATEWQTGPLSEDGQKWVTACMAARSNHYGVSVVISLRNTAASPALTADDAERSAYPYEEGAFWGNLFSTPPTIYSCYNSTNMAHSRSKQRVCATGYVDGQSTGFCENIVSVGTCSANCAQDGDAAKGYSTCGASEGVITTFLD